MADGLAVAKANSTLDSLLATAYVQLHTAPPGAAGTTAIATNNTRKAATFASASGGSKATSADLDWPSVPAAEDYTDCSLWDAVTAGNFICSGTITANAVSVGDDFKILAGNLTVSLPVAS
jgi:hypothetical protein